MNKLRTYIMLLSMFTLLTGCMDSSNKQLPSEQLAKETSVQQRDSKESLQPAQADASNKTDMLTGDVFKQPSDFVIKHFTLAYNKKQRTMVYHLEYTFGPDATVFLVDHQQPYYFQLEVPEKWREHFASTQSAEVKGSKLDGNSERIYSLKLVVPLQSGVTDSTIQQLTSDPYDYVLYLYEDRKFPARIISNIYGWMRSSE